MAVTDTNYILEVCSCHDLVNAYTDLHSKVGAAAALADPYVAYRRNRARDSMLLALHFNNVAATTYGLNGEPLRILLQRVPPMPGGKSLTSDFVNQFIYFVLERVLPNWTIGMPKEADEAKGDAADLVLLQAAKEQGLPLITNEGNNLDGLVDEGLRLLAKEAGVSVFTPREYLAGRIDEAEAISKFIWRFQTKAPAYMKERNRRYRNRDGVSNVLGWMIGYYEFVLLGKHLPVE